MRSVPASGFASSLATCLYENYCDWFAVFSDRTETDFDLECLIFRDRVWLDRAATVLYVMGTVGTGAAYLSGERAAKALEDLFPAGDFAADICWQAPSPTFKTTIEFVYHHQR